MTPFVITLALAAAVLHASWNAILRSGVDRVTSVTTMSLTMAVISAPVCLALPFPPPGAWPYLAASSSVQVGYSLVLVAAYRHGALSHVYPIMRGTVPVLVTVGGFFVAGQHLSLSAALGVALVCAGICGLALVGQRPRASSVGYAGATGMVVAAYNVIDARGVREVPQPLCYAAWICVLSGSMLVAVVLVARRRQPAMPPARALGMSVAGGLLSLAAYAAVVSAFELGPAGPITALRETSVVVAALIGHRFLGERLTGWRLTACAVVALGAVCLT